LFTEEGAIMLDKELVGRLLTTLGDRARLDIIFLLGEEGRMNVGEIASHFSLTRPAISYHLKLLKDAHVLQSERAGQEIHYRLDWQYVVDELLSIVTELRECAAEAAAETELALPCCRRADLDCTRGAI